jgi:hypothetical protein
MNFSFEYIAFADCFLLKCGSRLWSSWPPLKHTNESLALITDVELSEHEYTLLILQAKRRNAGLYPTHNYVLVTMRFCSLEVNMEDCDGQLHSLLNEVSLINPFNPKLVYMKDRHLHPTAKKTQFLHYKYHLVSAILRNNPPYSVNHTKPINTLITIKAGRTCRSVDFTLSKDFVFLIRSILLWSIYTEHFAMLNRDFV